MIMEQIFNKEQQEKAQFILNHPLAKLSDLRSNEIKDLAVVWCYYSGKIEGNTYTYVETEALLKDDITSEKKYLNDIRAKLNEILYQQEQYTNPLERAVYLHCNIAKLQPFIDGNKRTSRMVESIALMNADIIPVYSSKDADILNYRKGLIAFYETGDYSFYAGYFLDKQVERIKGIE